MLRTPVNDALYLKNMVKSLDKIAFELWAGSGEVKDLEDWAESELRKDNPHPDACELFNLSRHDAAEHALRLAKEILGFTPVSEKGEEWAIELLSQNCARLVAGEISPMKFCSLVQLFDANFIGMRTLEDGSLEYPEWLGDLWNHCDWCEDSWSQSNSPHLVAEARKIMEKT